MGPTIGTSIQDSLGILAVPTQPITPMHPLDICSYPAFYDYRAPEQRLAHEMAFAIGPGL